MATDLKISELPDAGALKDADLIPIVRTFGNERITAKTTVGALSGGGGNLGSSAKYKFGDTYFAIKNMGLGGQYNQVLVDEDLKLPTIGLYAINDEKEIDYPSASARTSTYLKLYGDYYASLGLNGNDVFMATTGNTQVLHNNGIILYADNNHTFLRHRAVGDVFSAGADCVQLRRGTTQSTILSSTDDVTDLWFNRKAVFSAGQDHVSVSIAGPTLSILEAGYNNSGRNGEYNYYTELHRYNYGENKIESLLHADNYALKMFHKNKCVIDYGTVVTRTGAKGNPFALFSFVDDSGTTEVVKKILEVSPGYTTLYHNNNQVLNITNSYFALKGIHRASNTPVPVIRKYASDTFTSFHDMSSTDDSSSVFMQVSPSEIKLFRNINLMTQNKDILVGNGNWTGQYLKQILNDLALRVRNLES